MMSASQIRKLGRRPTWALLALLSAAALHAQELQIPQASQAPQAPIGPPSLQESRESPTVVEATPENPQIAEAYTLLESGNTGEALKKFELVLEANTHDLSARLGQAMIFAEQQRHTDAFKAFDRIVDQHPRHAFAWNGRGLAAFNMENFDEALLSFKQATAEQPLNGFFYESLAWTLMCRGQWQEAAQSAKQATLMYHKSRENSAYPLLIAYFSYLETGDQQNAQTTLRYASENKPLNQWPSPVVDYLQGKLSEPELISYVTNTTQETEAHTYIGLKLRNDGRLDDAKQHLSWVAQNGDPRVFEYTLARVLNLREGVALLRY
jgi:tetratricopeptide (TPR) repeat protein